MKNKILMFVKVPPPVTGSVMMNSFVLNSKIINNSFSVRSVKVNYIKSIHEMGKWKLRKLFYIIIYIKHLLYELVFHRPCFVYFQISLHGVAFIRDVIYVTIIKLFKVNILFHIHGKGVSKHLKNSVKKRIYQLCFRGVGAITVSPLLSYDLKDLKISHLYYVNNGVPKEKYIAEKSNKVNDDTISLLFLSNIRESKGIFEFLEALKILKDLGHDFAVNIVGAETDVTEQDLNVRISDFGLKNNVHYRGPLYGIEKHEVLVTSDIFVFPTKNDIWGNVAIEAMQYSLPVIATRQGALPEIIDDGTNGFLIKENSPDQIADRISYLLKNKEKIIELGENGREKYLKHYTLDRFENNLCNVFKSFLIDME